MSRKNPVGIVFDIKEFSVFDGPGLRCTVFLKGCPLRCVWCHNPEGQNPEPEVMRTTVDERMVGKRFSASELEEKLLSYAPIFANGTGGITFSGGEPLFQAEFVVDVMKRLKGKIHLLLQTSGYAAASAFDEAAFLADEAYFDLKLVDSELHQIYTGVDNSVIMENLKRLDRSGQSYRLRVPLIPGVTDTPENYEAIRNFAAKYLKNCGGLDLLPYNPAAGGKYQALGRTFAPGFDEKRDLHVMPDFFRSVIEDVRAL